MPFTYLQATPEPAVGLTAATLTLKLGLYAWGVWPLEPGKGTKRVESGIYPHDVPWGEKPRDPGRTVVRRGPTPSTGSEMRLQVAP